MCYRLSLLICRFCICKSGSKRVPSHQYLGSMQAWIELTEMVSWEHVMKANSIMATCLNPPKKMVWKNKFMQLWKGCFLESFWIHAHKWLDEANLMKTTPDCIVMIGFPSEHSSNICCVLNRGLFRLSWLISVLVKFSSISAAWHFDKAFRTQKGFYWSMQRQCTWWELLNGLLSDCCISREQPMRNLSR